MNASAAHRSCKGSNSAGMLGSLGAIAASAHSYIFLDKPYAADSYVSLQLITIFIHAIVILLAVSVVGLPRSLLGDREKSPRAFRESFARLASKT